jgi:glycerol kinase
MSYLVALDQGTTSSRAIVFDGQCEVTAVAQQEFAQKFPQPGQVEHDPREIWQSQLQVMGRALQQAAVPDDEVAGVGITNQRETTIVWDRHSGEPVYPAIVWQDRRTANRCNRLKESGHESMIRQKTGLLIDPYFSATKLQWILDHVDGVRDRAEAGELAFGTVDTWLVWNLTGGRVHVTDLSNASRTMLLNIHSAEWDEELLQLFGIPRSLLPRLAASSEVVGHARDGLPRAGTPIAGIAGDQQAALLGQRCTETGMVKATYGTGCFMLMNTGTRPAESQHRLLTTIAWKIGDRIDYALEGSMFIAGALVQWLRDGVGLVESASEIEALAASVPDNGGVVLVPALAGLGAPHWDPWARGSLFGLTRATTRGHIARAALEGIAFQAADVLRAMQSDAGLDRMDLRVDGGVAANNLLMQFQADLLGVPVTRPRNLETTALGVACLAGLATGVWSEPSELDRFWQPDATFQRQLPVHRVQSLQHDWEKALARSRAWVEPDTHPG